MSVEEKNSNLILLQRCESVIKHMLTQSIKPPPPDPKGRNEVRGTNAFPSPWGTRNPVRLSATLRVSAHSHSGTRISLSTVSVRMIPRGFPSCVSFYFSPLDVVPRKIFSKRAKFPSQAVHVSALCIPRWPLFPHVIGEC